MFNHNYRRANVSNKIFLTVVRYCVPVLSVGFLIATVRYTALMECENLETYSSEDLATVTQVETQSEPIARGVDTITIEDVDELPEFSFSTIQEEVQNVARSLEPLQELETTQEDIVTATSISEDTPEMVDAYGVYVNDEFLGAITDTTDVQNALNNLLNKYLNMDNVTEAHFVEDIKYVSGTYVNEYILNPNVIVETLLGNSKEDIYYTVEDGDSLSLVAEISNITMDELLTLNPNVTDANVCHTGDSLLIQQAEPFLNVEYTKSIAKESEIPYETITQEDDTLPLGESEIITQGVNGTMKSIKEVKYLNDVEISSTTLEPQVVIEPISQVVSIGVAELEPSTTTETEPVAVSLNVGEFISPIESTLGYISDTFISDRNHKGIDIASAYDTEVQASANGKVISAGWNSGGYGYMVLIDHGSGYVTLYAHMSEVLVDVGQYVSTGETIGKVGSTGDSTGNHLHFELRLDNVCIDPQNYLIGLPN